MQATDRKIFEKETLLLDKMKKGYLSYSETVKQYEKLLHQCKLIEKIITKFLIKREKQFDKEFETITKKYNNVCKEKRRFGWAILALSAVSLVQFLSYLINL